LSPRAIRDAVLEEERPAFERQYRAALATAAETLDLTGLEKLLRAWHRIGELTERDGRAKRREILARAVRCGATAIPRTLRPCAGRGSSRNGCGRG
jgi:hypothetical protein